MSNPFAFGNGGVVQAPGDGAALASSIAQVLAAQQQQKETEYRQQQLAQQATQQQALAQYYQAQTANQQQQTMLDQQKYQSQVAGQRQVGGAMRGAMGGRPQLDHRIGPGGDQQIGGALPYMDGSSRGVPLSSAQTDTSSPLHQALQGGAQAIGGQQGYNAIFQGVSDENLSAAVQGVQEVQKMTAPPEMPEMPTAAKEFMFAQQLAGIDPKLSKFFIENWVNKGPATVVNNIPQKGETKFSEKLGENQATAIQQREDEARSIGVAFPSMSEAYKLVDKSFTGFGANQLLGLARVAGQAGFKPSGDKVADTQTMVKLLREQTLAYLQTRALGSGTAVSDKDREFMERQSAADITMDPAAIKRIIRVNVGIGLEKTEQGIKELRSAASAYPSNARELDVKASRLQRQYDVQWKEYTRMLQQEGTQADQTRKRLEQAGLQLPGAR